jgi:hypothetical protein
MKNGRSAYFITPWKPYFGDSGQINGLSGSGGYRDPPLQDDNGVWLEFDSFAAAVAAATERGYDRGDVCEYRVYTIAPEGNPAHQEWSDRRETDYRHLAGGE